MPGIANPRADIEQYMTGLSNRLMLLTEEEIKQLYPKLLELRELIDRKMKQ